MSVYSNVLGSIMVDRIMHKVDGSLIITMKLEIFVVEDSLTTKNDPSNTISNHAQ
jgi:hypothetical protein